MGNRDAPGEAARLCRAIDQLRNADNDRKAPFLRELSAMPCESHCTLKRVCESAYREHVGAIEAIRDIQAYRTPAAPEGDTPNELASKKLEEAERRLRSSRELAQKCVDRQGEVKRRYRL